MAISRNGLRIGRAGAADLQDQRRELYEAQDREAARLREQARLDLADARDDLKALDPDGWEAWWDSDALPDAPYIKMLPIVRARVAELRKASTLKAIFSVMKNA